MRRKFLGIAVALSCLLGAAVVHAQCPAFIPVVGLVNLGNAPDPVGSMTFTVDPSTPVTIDFTGCCDINLCGVSMSQGQGQMVCPGVITGTSSANGLFSFTVLGAAKDPGNRVPPAEYGGCGANGVVVTRTIGGTPVVCASTAFCLDQNGAAGYPARTHSNGVSASDIANVLNLFGACLLNGTYYGRGDIDQSGVIGIGDVGAIFGHFGRLSLIQQVGCEEPPPYCVKPNCP